MHSVKGQQKYTRKIWQSIYTLCIKLSTTIKICSRYDFAVAHTFKVNYAIDGADGCVEDCGDMVGEKP